MAKSIEERLNEYIRERLKEERIKQSGTKAAKRYIILPAEEENDALNEKQINN